MEMIRFNQNFLMRFYRFFALLFGASAALMPLRETITIGPGEHHRLQAVDKLCPPTQVQNNTCFVTAKDVRLTYDFVYESDLNMIFDNTEVQCITTTMHPCDVHFKTGNKTQITLRNGSRLVGKQVLIDAPEAKLVIEDSSQISVSGQSLNSNGTQVRMEHGAQFIAQGGACDVSRENYTVFGNFDMLPNHRQLAHFMNQMGSIGQEGDAETAGGGRIVLILDSLTVSAWGAPIQANAKPFDEVAQTSKYQLTGGSGGYIYITTHNKHLENDLGEKFRVEAKGGSGTKGSYGGSGGVIIFDGSFELSTRQVTASGGGSLKTPENQDGCGNGGAGTLWYRQKSRLIIDNENKPTPQKTVITVHAAQGSQESSEMVSVLADDILIDGGADVWIDSKNSHDLKINNLELTNGTTLGIVTTNDLNFTLHIEGTMKFAPDTLVDFSHINNMRLNATNWWTSYNLGNVMFAHILQISGGYVTIDGNVNVTDRDYHSRYDSKVIVNAEMLRLTGKATLETAFFFAHAHGPIWIDSGFNLTSIIKQTCSAEYHVPKMFSCIPPKALNPEITFESFMENYDQQFGVKSDQIEDTVSILAKGYLVYLMSENYIVVDEASIHAPRIGFCSPNIQTRNATLDAKERGCWGGHGIGKGWMHTNCSGGGGSHGGVGGFGMSKHGRRCDVDLPKPYSWGDEASYEGSSGGGPLDYLESFGGNGGGIIWLIASDTIKMNDTLVTVKGGDGRSFFPEKLGGGGGAGGSINIVTKNIAGNAIIDAAGGNGSTYGGGGGSGGRMIAHLLGNYNATNMFEQSLHWNGTVLLEGGKGGSTNSMFEADNEPAKIAKQIAKRTDDEFAGDGEQGTSRQTKCFGGFSGPFCKPCPVGTFKYNFGTGVCLPCTNKPEYSFYNDIAQSSSVCSYECLQGFESVEVNPHCLTSIDLQIEKAGGSVSFLFVVAFFLMLSLVLWMVISARSGCIQKSHFDRYATVYKNVLFNDDMSISEDEREAMVGPQNLSMKDSDIWSHTHRMYFIGENSVNYPWFLTRDFPTNALTEQNKEKLLKFIHKDQWTMDWTTSDRAKYILSRVFCPCGSEAVHRSLRRQHLRSASEKLYRSFDPSDWENITERTLRMSTDEGNRLGYLDFLDYRKNKANYQGPKLPMTLLLAGNGTMESPYRLNFLDDPLAKSLVYLDKETMKVKLPPFLQNLNTLLDKLDFFKFNRQTMKDLNDVVEWIALGNRTIFQQVGVKMQLYVFENSYQEVVNSRFVQRRRSMPIENEVFERFPALFKRLIQHVQLKLLTQHAEIKLGVVFKATSVEQQQQIHRKMCSISEMLNGQNADILQTNRTPISELYADDQDAQDFVSEKSKKAQKVALGNLDREMSESLLDQQTSMVMIHGTGREEQVQIVDKSKRAFDISVEATRLLEIKLQKEKKHCKHSCTRLKSVFYSLFILLFKFHGAPPTARLNALFLLYSLVLSFELVLSTVFITHVFNPFRDVWTIGLAYVFVLPGLSIIAPLFGLLATLAASPRMLLIYSSMNATLAIVTYPLTLVTLLFFKDPATYVGILLLLFFNKIFLSFYGGKVRQHFVNPAYAKVCEKMNKELVQMMKEDQTGRFHSGLSKAEKAQVLLESGRPELDHESSSEQDIPGGQEASEEDLFGIKPTSALRVGPGDSSNGEQEEVDSNDLIELDNAEETAAAGEDM